MRRTRQLLVPLSRAEWERLRAAAHRRGFSLLADYARVVLIREVDHDTWAIEASQDTPAEPDERAPDTWPPPPPDPEEP